MKYLIPLLLCLMCCGCVEKTNGTSINVENMIEDYGKWVIVSSSVETTYFYVARFSEKEFGKLWLEGYTLELLPQKEFDSAGEGMKIMNTLESDPTLSGSEGI